MVLVSRGDRLTDDEQETLNKLLSQLGQKKNRNRLRKMYLDGKKHLDKVGISIPPNMKDFETVLGWPEKTCQVFSRRIRPESFTARKESSLLDVIRDEFENDVVQFLERQAIDSSAQLSVSFVFQSVGDLAKGEPEIVTAVRDAESATALRDPRSRKITAALECVEQDQMLLHLPGVVHLLSRSSGAWRKINSYETVDGLVFCTPYVHNASVSRPWGKSRITRPVMGFTEMAVRTLLRQEVSAEFYSAPQRYLLGADQDMFTDQEGNPIPIYQALLGSIWAVPDPDPEESPDAQRVTVGEFTQQSMQPHSDQLRTIAMFFSGETSIPPGYLGIIQDNPESAEAKWASETDLVLAAEDEQTAVAMARADMARKRVALLEGEWTEDMARDLSTLGTHFRDASTPTQQSLSQSVATEVGAGILPPQSQVTWERLGYSQSMISQLKDEQRQGRVQALVNSASQVAAKAMEDQRVADLVNRRA